MLLSLLKWTVIASVIGIITGIINFSFVTTVDILTAFRKEHEWLIYLLPIIGVIVVFIYHRFGKEIENGNDLIIDEIHNPKKIVPIRMLPMIYFSSSLSHLFGASVGREGVGVQIGASLSDQFSKFFNNRKILLIIGMSAGFSSIFGAPVAGTIFGLEVLSVGIITYEAIYPALIASVSGFFITKYLGFHPFSFQIMEVPPLFIGGILSAIVAGVCFGLTARFFSFCLFKIKDFYQRNCKHYLLRPFVGGSLLALLFLIVGSDRYHGLGFEIIAKSFTEHLYPWDFVGKTFLTTLSLGSGFKGGEVMSLFYIGSSLGNILSYILPLSFPVLASLGFVSVFGGAANTPITALLLGLELFGTEYAIYFAITVTVSYIFSGKMGIYKSQKNPFQAKVNY